ncbi:MAG: RtcB family protein [Gemmataceae bacterium]
MAKDVFGGPLERVDPCCWRIPKSYKPGMNVDGLIFASDTLMKQLVLDQAPEQVANVACLPGIQVASLAMPDIHWGYGFCIGGVAATDPDEGGVVSPGGVGYDINYLTGDARVLHHRLHAPRIDEMATAVGETGGVRPRAPLSSRPPYSPFGKRPNRPILELTSRAGDRARAGDADTRSGRPTACARWRRCGPVIGSACTRSRACPTEDAGRAVLISEDDLPRREHGSAGAGRARRRRPARRGLLPLTTTSAALAGAAQTARLRLRRWVDSLRVRHRQGIVSFTADEDDLETIGARPPSALGVTPSPSTAATGGTPSAPPIPSITSTAASMRCACAARRSPCCWSAWVRRSARRRASRTPLPAWLERRRARCGTNGYSSPACSAPELTRPGDRLRPPALLQRAVVLSLNKPAGVRGRWPAHAGDALRLDYARSASRHRRFTGATSSSIATVSSRCGCDWCCRRGPSLLHL